MKKYLSILLFFFLPFICAAQKAIVKVKVKNGKSNTVKMEVPVDGTWFVPSARQQVLEKDSTLTISLAVDKTTRFRVDGFGVIVDPGLTELVLDYSKKQPLQYVSRNMEGQRLFDQRDQSFYQDRARAYYKKDSTATGLLNMIDVDHQEKLKPYKELLAAQKISNNFYDHVATYFMVDYNIIEAAIPMLVFSEKKRLSPELEKMWGDAYKKMPPNELKYTFHPDFYYHADYYSFTYLDYFQSLKKGLKLEIKDEDTYFRRKYENFGARFKGKIREYLLASFLRNEMMQEKFQVPLLDLFADFQRQYPKSKFSEYIQPYSEKIIAFHKQKATEANAKQVILKNYDQINSFDELLGRFKDKTVYIDVWATWCGPCKQEFEHGKALEHYLNSQGVEMLFISTDKDEADEQWKTMIKYYNLEGSHVRTNKALLQDMLNKFWDGKGYAIPRYLLVKNGKVLNSNMLRPSDKEKLYSQIETLIK